MEYYHTVGGEALFEQTIQNSRFIARLSPVTSEQEAADFIDGIKRMHKDATHHCYAYYIFEKQIKRFFDDGEPGSTAGLPIFDVLIRGEVYDCVIVVTRYFGGTLLGSGGLVRAYSSTARGALEHARLLTMIKSVLIHCQLDYPYVRPLERYIKNAPQMRIQSAEYTDKVRLQIACQSDFAPELGERIQELSMGSAEYKTEKTIFLPWES